MAITWHTKNAGMRRAMHDEEERVYQGQTDYKKYPGKEHDLINTQYPDVPGINNY